MNLHSLKSKSMPIIQSNVPFVPRLPRLMGILLILTICNLPQPIESFPTTTGSPIEADPELDSWTEVDVTESPLSDSDAQSDTIFVPDPEEVTERDIITEVTESVVTQEATGTTISPNFNILNSDLTTNMSIVSHNISKNDIALNSTNTDDTIINTNISTDDVDTTTATESVDTTDPETAITTTESNQPDPNDPESDPTKSEILSELQSIWHYSQELGDDQNDLKLSLSSLVHITYARVYDQSDDTLVRLKFLLRKLRARLLEENETFDQVNNLGNLNQNQDQEAATPISYKEDNPTDPKDAPTDPKLNPNRKKRSTKRSNRLTNFYNDFNNTLILAKLDMNSGENSLFPEQNDNDRMSYTIDNIEKDAVQPPQRIKDANHLSGPTSNENDIDHNYVHVTIMVPQKDKESLENQKLSTVSTFSTDTLPITITNSKGQSFHDWKSTLEPSSTLSYDELVTPDLKYLVSNNKKTLTKVKLQAIKDKYQYEEEQLQQLTPAPIPEYNSPNDDNDEKDKVPPPAISSTVDEIIQSIIDVLRAPIKIPTQIHQDYNQNQEGISSLSSYADLWKPKPVLHSTTTESNYLGWNSNGSEILQFINRPQGNLAYPSYLQNLGQGSVGSLNLGSGSLGSPSTNNESTVSNINTSYILDPNVNVTTLTDLTPVDLPPSGLSLNVTMEKLLVIANTVSSLPNTSILVLLFCVGISFLSIALGFYSLGPPIVAVGVLGILLPVFMVFLFQSNLGRKKGKHEQGIMALVDRLDPQDFVHALDLLADAIAKYEH